MLRLPASTTLLTTVPVMGLITVLLTGCDDIPDLSPANQPPVANDDVVELLQGAELLFNLVENDSDIDGNLESYELIGDAANGTLVALEGFTIRYTPDRGFVGSENFSYRLTDTKGESSEADVTINVYKRQLRALYATVDNGLRRVFMVDSRNRDTAVDLSANLDPQESVRDWKLNTISQQLVMLTDADRIVQVPLGDPADVSTFEIEVTAGQVIDERIAVSPFANLAAYSIDNRHVHSIDLVAGDVTTVDTGWTNSTMTVDAFFQGGTAVVATGVLDGNETISLVPFDGTAVLTVLSEPQPSGTLHTTHYPSASSMSWLFENNAQAGEFSCDAPPVPELSDVFYVTLTAVSNAFNVIESSGLFPDPNTLLRYDLASAATTGVTAACQGGSDILGLYDLALSNPTASRLIASADDNSDALLDVDVSPDGDSVVYVLEGDTGRRIISADLSGEPVTSEVSSLVPDYQRYDFAGPQIPSSGLSSDNRLWMFIAPVADSPQKLVWVDLVDEAAQSTELPFAATNPMSDGFYAFVTALDTKMTTTALVELAAPTVSSVVVPGVLDDQASPVVLAPIPLAELLN